MELINIKRRLIFLSVGRIENEKVMLLAWYSHRGFIDIKKVHEVLDKAQTVWSSHSHYSFTHDKITWHICADDIGLVYILLCDEDYPSRCSISCLEEFKRTFAKHTGEKVKFSKEGSLNFNYKDLLVQICKKYDNLENIDKLTEVQQKVDSVKLTVQENVQIALDNCVKLEDIDKTAEELRVQAGIFQRTAKEIKWRMCWKNIKVKLLLAFIILAVIGIIIGVTVAYAKQSKSKAY